MTGTELTLTSGALAMLLVQLLKWIVKPEWKLFGKVIKAEIVDLPAWVYAISMPVFSALSPFILVLLGVPSDDPILGMGWNGVLVYVLRVGVTSLIGFVSYNQGVKPIKDYNNLQKAKEVQFEDMG